jgi:FAD/FMN-containing dehydrogenase
VVHVAEAPPPRTTDAARRELHRRLKDSFDPRHRLNPGYDPLAL